MNAFGVRVDEELIEGALSIDAVCNEKLTNEAVGIYRISKSEQSCTIKNVD